MVVKDATDFFGKAYDYLDLKPGDLPNAVYVRIDDGKVCSLFVMQINYRLFVLCRQRGGRIDVIITTNN